MLYTCSPDCRDPRHAHGTPRAVLPADRPRTVDVHCHYLNTAVAAKAAALEPARHDPSTIFANALTRETNRLQMLERAGPLSDVARRLADMDRMGIDLQVVSPAPFQYHYFAPPATGAALARETNEGLRALVESHPDRLAALGTVPLQDCDLAMHELEHAVAHLGLRGVEIGTNVNGMDLTDPRLAWSASSRWPTRCRPCCSCTQWATPRPGG